MSAVDRAALPGPGVIRSAGVDDAPAIQAIYAPYVEGSAVTFETEAPTVAEMAERIAAVLPVLPWLVFEVDGAIAGYAYAAPHRARAAYRWSIDVSVYLAPQYQGRGIGRALYDRLLATCRALGYYNAFAGITLPNTGSVALHEACGFRPLGVYRDVGFKLGRWRDVGWWQCVLRPAEGTPDAPRRPEA